MSFYSNSRTAYVDIKCQLRDIEKQTPENERLYRAFILQNNPLDFAGWAPGKPHGSYVMAEGVEPRGTAPPKAELPTVEPKSVAQNDPTPFRGGDVVKQKSQLAFGCADLDDRKALMKASLYHLGGDGDFQIPRNFEYANSHCSKLDANQTGLGTVVDVADSKVLVDTPYPVFCVKFENQPVHRCLWVEGKHIIMQAKR